MAQQDISELYAGNSWLTVYEAFTQINFSSYDFNSIRQAMKDYITKNYPDKFNDWSENSEFVILIDLLAYFGQTMAFRMDLNTRENFLSTAERRESILRLARFLSYSPQRNYSANGLVKLTSLSINEDIYDSNGNNLNGITVKWNDSSNTNWYEQWFAILNQILISTNPFGTPLQEYSIDSVDYQQYRIDNVPLVGGTIPFSTSVNGTNYNFDLCNLTLSETYGVYEDTPTASENFNIVYLNDGNGYDSTQTGFFMLMKQGNLQNQTFTISDIIENRKVYVNVKNINETDVWLQTLNNDSTIKTNWTKVGYTPNSNPSEYIGSQNVTYNAIDQDIKTVYQVITEPNDQIMMRFGDGNFGAIPYGTMRIWYRTGSNDGVIIKTSDMKNISSSLNYYSNNIQKTCTFTFSSVSTIDNGTVSETNDQIKDKAPNFYTTQGRMVSGNDYNVLPNNINIAKKTSAVNRMYSGQSRYLDMNDPTGTYQNIDLISDDGILFIEDYDSYTEVSTSTTNLSNVLINETLIDIVGNNTLRNFLYSKWLSYANFISSDSSITWNASSSSQYDYTGYISVNNIPVEAGSVENTNLVQYIQSNCLIKFKNAGWVGVVSIDNTIESINTNGKGQVTLNTIVESNDIIEQVLPYYSTNFSSTEKTNISSQISNNKTFGLGYDYSTLSWYVINYSNINYSSYDITTKGTSSDSSWLILFEYSPNNWRVNTRGIRFVFEASSSKFFIDTSNKVIDIDTGLAKKDTINLLKYNGYANDIGIDISNNYILSSGYYDPSKVIVDYSYTLDLVNDPDVFQTIISDNIIFHKLTTNTNGYQNYTLITNVNIVTDIANIPSTLGSTDIYYLKPTSGDLTLGTFYVGSSLSVSDYVVNYGTNNLIYIWKHYAPNTNRIDPAITNVIDIFVLTNGYYTLLTEWRDNGLSSTNMPTIPTEQELRSEFASLEDIKMFSDEIVWRPASIKYIFGEYSDQNLKCSFKVVPTQTNTLSNGELASNILSLIYSYFDVDNWSFGDTFYFTKLSNYIISNMNNQVSAFYIVPLSDNQSYGDLQEIQSNNNELFFPTTIISDIEIINTGNKTNLRIN